MDAYSTNLYDTSATSNPGMGSNPYRPGMYSSGKINSGFKSGGSESVTPVSFTTQPDTDPYHGLHEGTISQSLVDGINSGHLGNPFTGTFNSPAEVQQSRDMGLLPKTGTGSYVSPPVAPMSREETEALQQLASSIPGGEVAHPNRGSGGYGAVTNYNAPDYNAAQYNLRQGGTNYRDTVLRGQLPGTPPPKK